MTDWIGVLLAFLAGFATAHYSPFRLKVERNKMPYRLVSFKDGHAARSLAVLIAFALLATMGITAFARAENVNDDLRESVLCFSDYNKKYAQASLARTNATALADEAREDYDAAVQEYLTAAAQLVSPEAPTTEEIERVRKATVEFDFAAAQVRKTNADLTRAREEQPYPAFPTNFCAPEEKK